jgi:hypothetical protein
MNNEGKVSGSAKDTSSVYYYGNLRLYHLTYQYNLRQNGVNVLSEIRNHYLAYKIGDKYGMDYDDHKQPVARRVLLDSAFRMEWIQRNRLYITFTGYATSLVSSRPVKDSGLLYESYIFRDKNTNDIAARADLVFDSRYSEIDVTLSKELDSIKHMKLTSIKFNYTRKVLKEGYIKDAYETELSLTEKPVMDRGFILSFFDRYLQDSNSSQGKK